MKQPGHFPTLLAKDDSSERFCRAIERIRAGAAKGDARANFAAMALSRMPRFVGVSYTAHYIKPEDRAADDAPAIVRGNFILAAGSQE